jgi:hypothetical protein
MITFAYGQYAGQTNYVVNRIAGHSDGLFV